MGCSASHEEPPRQQPSQKKPSQAQAANLHPSMQQKKYPTQQQPQQQQQQQQQPAKQVQAVPLTKETLHRYLELEKKLHQMEGKNVVKAVKAKEEALAGQVAHVKALEENLKKCDESVKKEKDDVDMLTEGGVGGLVANNETLAQEKEEYVEALNKQEIAKKELDEAVRQRDLMAADVDKMKQSAEEVEKLMDERDDLLDGIFAGSYGSELENKLEGELYMFLEKKRRISVAKYKWQNGRVLIQYAVNQLAFAVKKWTFLKDTPREDAKTRYTLATESRNNLVAANQNITSAQRYLNTIVFPYCKPAEMDTLQRATNNIYTDMQTPDRHAHAHNVYNVTHKRAAALLQWFDHVIATTIMKDFAAAKKAAHLKEQELQKERIALLQAKAKQELGETVEIQQASQLEADEDDNDGPDTELMALATKTGGEGEEDNTTTDNKNENAPAATPLPENELAPPPSSDDLFGDIDDLKRQHDKDMEEFQKQQELNKARIDQGLQEKLARRRSRKRKSENA